MIRPRQKLYFQPCPVIRLDEICDFPQETADSPCKKNRFPCRRYSSTPSGRSITNVRDNGDGRVVVDMSDATTYGPFYAASGPQGPQGDQGPQGPQGEVSSQQLSDAIAGTSANTNAVETLDSSFADADTETLRQKLNELIGALRR